MVIVSSSPLYRRFLVTTFMRAADPPWNYEYLSRQRLHNIEKAAFPLRID
jgi:hypothetical protein